MSKYTEGKFKKDDLVTVWGDVVALKELTISILISVIFGLAGYFLAPAGDSIWPLLFSILGIVLATVINSILFKPKRVIQVEEERESDS